MDPFDNWGINKQYHFNELTFSEGSLYSDHYQNKIEDLIQLKRSIKQYHMAHKEGTVFYHSLTEIKNLKDFPLTNEVLACHYSGFELTVKMFKILLFQTKKNLRNKRDCRVDEGMALVLYYLRYTIVSYNKPLVLTKNVTIQPKELFNRNSWQHLYRRLFRIIIHELNEQKIIMPFDSKMLNSSIDQINKMRVLIERGSLSNVKIIYYKYKIFWFFLNVVSEKIKERRIKMSFFNANQEEEIFEKLWDNEVQEFDLKLSIDTNKRIRVFKFLNKIVLSNRKRAIRERFKNSVLIIILELKYAKMHKHFSLFKRSMLIVKKYLLLKRTERNNNRKRLAKVKLKELLIRAIFKHRVEFALGKFGSFKRGVERLKWNYFNYIKKRAPLVRTPCGWLELQDGVVDFSEIYDSGELMETFYQELDDDQTIETMTKLDQDDLRAIEFKSLLFREDIEGIRDRVISKTGYKKVKIKNFPRSGIQNFFYNYTRSKVLDFPSSYKILLFLGLIPVVDGFQDEIKNESLITLFLIAFIFLFKEVENVIQMKTNLSKSLFNLFYNGFIYWPRDKDHTLFKERGLLSRFEISQRHFDEKEIFVNLLEPIKKKVFLNPLSTDDKMLVKTNNIMTTLYGVLLTTFFLFFNPMLFLDFEINPILRWVILSCNSLFSLLYMDGKLELSFLNLVSRNMFSFLFLFSILESLSGKSLKYIWGEIKRISFTFMYVLLNLLFIVNFSSKITKKYYINLPLVIFLREVNNIKLDELNFKKATEILIPKHIKLIFESLCNSGSIWNKMKLMMVLISMLIYLAVEVVILGHCIYQFIEEIL